MMLRVARHILLVLIAFALVGGTTTQLARAARYPATMATTGMPCDMVMSVSGHGKPMKPCGAMTPDCLKQMGGVTDIGLPAPPARDALVTHAGAADYWPHRSRLAGLIHPPEPLPPRTT
jgi:hypothetical protein